MGLPEGKDHQGHQVHLELKERKGSLDSPDWICLAPKAIKALKDFLASQDSQASLAFLDSRGHLEFQGSQVLKVKWVSWEPRDNQLARTSRHPRVTWRKRGPWPSGLLRTQGRPWLQR